MKKIVFIIISLILFVSLNAQTKFKVINGVTKQPIKDQYCNITKDDDTWVDIGNTDNKGIFKPDFIPDSNGSYQLSISADGFKPFKENVNLFSNKLITISIFPDTELNNKKPNLVYSTCTSRYFGHYRPKTPSSLNELPDTVRDKLVKHLESRLGSEFYSKLKFSGGQIVNLERLYLVEANAKNYKWIPQSYYLCFSFRDTAKGIGLYTSRIILDKHGNVVEEIQLPDIKSNPDKANLISRQSAISIARNNTFTPTSDKISLNYDLSKDSLVWCFEKTTNDNGLTFSIETLIIDAHTGKVHGIAKGGGIR